VVYLVKDGPESVDRQLEYRGNERVEHGRLGRVDLAEDVRRRLAAAGDKPTVIEQLVRGRKTMGRL
jgi:hypothetical protein